MYDLLFFFFNDTATTEIYTLSYTTLFRSKLHQRASGGCAQAVGFRRRTGQPVAIRSEEHTSELQSRLHLVCRLLLEKKKLEVFAIASTSSIIPSQLIKSILGLLGRSRLPA